MQPSSEQRHALKIQGDEAVMVGQYRQRERSAGSEGSIRSSGQAWGRLTANGAYQGTSIKRPAIN